MSERLLAEPACVDWRAGAGGEFERARDEIGVDMGLEDGGDPETALGRPVDIGIDVPPGIDHGDFARRLVGDEIGNLGQPGREDAVNDHGELRDDVARPPHESLATIASGPRQRQTIVHDQICR